MAKKNSMKYIMGLIFVILIGTASWAFYDIINSGASDFLNMFGITNNYAQGATVIGFVIVLLVFVWKMKVESVINKVVK